eukprot:CAMPEP_0113607506 /NCGR_PEP_ID=MMETSP0017_2-20120614/3423_1 /TAXON_ID=2856 /ORGANISM="Cylindrotheca closterium" /LENGTH=783 /DNA_ID=CAMNT_0000516119 /DNA_START=44 /DNA_END=2395 /DNA_ORIENTATION=+ /assembly_acc=CAM_ASM_000147
MAVLPVASGNLCFMLYQMADNDLEYFIRQDLEEYSNSAMIKDSTTRTWVFFDHRNFDTTPVEEEIAENLPFVYDSQGNALSSTKPDGSFYYTYDHTLQKLVVDSDIGETNSDVPKTVSDFATKALADCKQAGSTEYFIAFSSHGTGFEGFGGDENIRRRLEGVQTNSDIVSALRTSLDANGIDKFDMIGFDACLMMAYGALDDFKSVSKYFLASEEVEPGHGWSYSGLTAQSAVDTAKSIVTSFINDMQGDEHQTPKTLAIVDQTKYEAFSSAWNTLSKEIKDLMAANDAEVAIAFSRARAIVYNFASSYDEDNAKDKASVDMFGLISGFERLCRPTGNLSTLLANAKTAYADMFVDRQTGLNTPTALTGMHVFFPSRARYASKDLDWDKILFNDAVTATTSAPEWLNLMKAYYSSTTPTAGGSSVCGTSTGTTDTASGSDLLTNAKLSGSPASGLTFQATVARSVDTIFVEYGMNLTPLLTARRNRRSLGRKNGVVGGHDHQTQQQHPRYMARRANRNRKLQTGTGDFAYLYSGDIVGSFAGAEYFANWDGNFFALGNSATGYQDIYVFDYGEGLKEFPVMYFPSSKPVTADTVIDMMTYADAEAAGGTYGYVSFSENNLVGTKITAGIGLYTVSTSGDTFSEVPRTREGQIVPVNFADAEENGVIIDYYIGGFYGDSIIEWNTNSAIEINSIRGIDYKNEQGGESFTLDGIASDDDTGAYTVVLFEVDDAGTILDNSTSTDVAAPTGGTGGTGGGGGTGSGAQHLSATLAVSFIGLLVSLF